MDRAVQIDLRGARGKIAAGQAAQHWQGRVGFVPQAQPRIAVRVEGITERQPAVRLAWFDASLVMPVRGPVAIAPPTAAIPVRRILLSNVLLPRTHVTYRNVMALEGTRKCIRKRAGRDRVQCVMI